MLALITELRKDGYLCLCQQWWWWLSVMERTSKTWEEIILENNSVVAFSSY